MIKIEVSDPVFRFLSGFFHKDIYSPESSLDEYLIEIPKEKQENDVVALKEFIKSDYSDEEKNDFIDETAYGVDILSYGVTPIIWLEQVIQKIEKNIETL
ncbi:MULTISPECIES: contact-dependent growth inhibition system immunity protein [unclassified Bacillus (in: firmicutes)]|uniref:contact-dependent growth inhibition system immunity protein n=1 Tax=unclassified Bacillus (in: firmicutes) TaxID=185979 RepID=UPI00227E436B|nr:contact-dependent growth inhibition system immunity protein [Bacillus sp. S20C3]MCY8288021.1 contact-dependent growth inhibition system immunity protein [Bacillus sp. N13C7]MCY8636813.1 contact-dependent growth inhibition system immunity protein [Bacillus sp. S17B2]MCY8720462.1 contact-dependent growth inhibition system immunity protein [Bacillus sp. S10C12M]MCY9145867.1 contact-dependent growth inhibition system immunity protein [Bacillus sp. T9C1]